MIEIKKVNCVKNPGKFQDLGNGSWYYNFNFKISNTTENTPKGPKDVDLCEYSQVRIQGKPTVEKCYNAILKSYSNEQGNSLYDLINSLQKTDEEIELAGDIYDMILVDFGVKEPLSDLEKSKNKVLRQISEYDASANVNSFFLNGLQVWLDKSTRVGLMNSLNIEKMAGKETSTLWFGNIKLDINTGAAIQMLSSLELYALECYNKTAEHKVNIENMTSVEDVINYDFTEGYPDKLNLSV